MQQEEKSEKLIRRAKEIRLNALDEYRHEQEGARQKFEELEKELASRRLAFQQMSTRVNQLQHTLDYPLTNQEAVELRALIRKEQAEKEWERLQEERERERAEREQKKAKPELFGNWKWRR